MNKFLLMLMFFSASFMVNAAENGSDDELTNEFSGLKFRNIGPALMSGRISDIAIHPDDENTWYVGVASGGVWKTTNSGTTWEAIFDDEAVYSIGSVTIDPSHPERIWVGTGENVGGRHMSFGDGIYLSEDGGQSWNNMGLQQTERISTVVIHPEDSNTLWVAAQGPLWSKGGQRGLYKTTDGGLTWNKHLGDEAWTGVTDVVIDPRNPDRLYAATWQRHRTVAAYMGGGPNTAIYKSEDGGENWQQLEQGLPDENMGKIGLAISPQQPDVIYAAIELERRTGGIYKSVNQGATWEKQSDAVAGGTGPHYYQELYVSPHVFDRLYLMSNYMILSDDGGKTYRTMNETNKHVDNHAIAFKASDPDYVLVGTDGGLYETFDLTQTWKFVGNLPITQFYKVAVDDAEPFYHIYGGTQDNNTQGGPSRTDNVHGIRNSDWYVVLFGDGHQPATEPGNPDIVYAEWQQGNLVRVDKTTGEMVYIQPQPAENEPAERFNWDAPILVSPHNPTTLYFASQRLWRSDDRGDSWVAISPDLTKNQERIELPIMGATQGWDMPWDLLAMSNYNTITSISESPQQAGLLYIGTDDGIIQVSADGGKQWKKVDVGSLPGVPETAFVNDIKADLHNADTVYVALDNHKYGDFKPYLLKSTNRGKSWQNISKGIPNKHLVWRVVQDHIDPQLLFAGTEFGVFFSHDGGGSWVELNGGMPTISIRDLAIQKRENDLVAASFGRGFFVLDDYSLLRNLDADTLSNNVLFPVKQAWWYLPRMVLGFDAKASQGDAFYRADNPPFGAVFHYHLKADLKSQAAKRKATEKKALESNKNITFPGWDVVAEEKIAADPKVWLTVKNAAGQVVRRVSGGTDKGFNQAIWDLRYPPNGVLGEGGSFYADEPQGMMVAPGTYHVSMSQEENGVVTALGEAQTFEVKPLRKGALAGADAVAVADFWQQLSTVQHAVAVTGKKLSEAIKRTKKLEAVMKNSMTAHGQLDQQLHRIKQELHRLDMALNGNRAKQEVGEKTKVTVGSRLGSVLLGTTLSTYGPTPTHRQSLALASSEHEKIKTQLEAVINNEMSALERELAAVGAPYIH